MKTTARRLPRTPIALAAALLTAFLVLFAPLSASAHDSLLASSPEADSTVDTLPGELTLTFSAKLIDEVGATEVLVMDPSGAPVVDGAATVDGAIVTQPLVTEAVAGAYHVVWKVVSSDGHPTSGEFDFTVTNSTESVPTDEPTDAPTTAAPTPSTTVGPDSSITPTPDAVEQSPPSAIWIWVVSIIAVLVIVGITTWLVIRGRRNRTETDSDTPSER